ncbi:Murein L,D-transpeptidase YcbB/YkuD [Nitrosomonas marina]|uniref:Murein L,D-transpeptidase YcbB/YkuD n=1 Tax=Nitrosomonas marina TaxID=917 RepID=A0A1I0BZ56_9PROT|nr:L,D-transpeptidase family protein [Nitrosomonas marina]SET12310.1 Murein L,D-transpeptidase YcbB/YkuD [Nitrosomonas marina]
MPQTSFFINFFSGLVLLHCTSLSQATTFDTESLQSALNTFVSRYVDDPRHEYIDLTKLQEFYSARDYRPAWTDSVTQLTRLEIALSFIGTAENEGLESREYRLDRLMQLFKTRNPSERFELEFLTTLSLLRFSNDLYRGRFTASRLDPDWHIPQPAFNAINFLLSTVDTDTFQQSLLGLAPNIPNYHLLKQVLLKFRNLAERGVSWQHIPDMPLLRPGESHQAIPLIRIRIAQAYETHDKTEYNLSHSEESINSTIYDRSLVNAIKAFQLQHGLNADGIIGKNTINALNKTLDEKIQQLRITMERLRWLPRELGSRYLLVNTAGFQLAAVENDEYMLDMRIIVGRDYRSTPSFNSRITHLIINPYWNIPASIASKDLLPKQQKNPDYFTSQNIRVYSDYAYNAEPIDPDSIDWLAIRRGFPYILRQDPGIHNALGTIKFMLPNPFSIYLHDTPTKTLFNKDIRTFSSGCIRLEKPLQLAEFALRKQLTQETLKAQIEFGKTRQINLPEPLPTFIVYLTAWIDSENNIHYSPDSYQRDRRALAFARW